ncbi:MAG TPA: RRXRR domain-containing protein [Streptomyces sp.]|nr:RRXRR domain-containing protein [Streptomyces sp.]HET6357924.1 RRXRR domain-containing protein [Streptomyces sp.]
MPPGPGTRTPHQRRAVVARQAPFTIRLKDRTRADSDVAGVQLRIDPGSKGTGIALTDTKTEIAAGGTPMTVRRGLASVELQHRGEQIHKAMGQRAGYRHRRRSANCRYRARRSNNRTRPRGWLAPSLRHRVDSTLSIARRLCQYAPVTEIDVERVAFDTHAMSEGRSLRSSTRTARWQGSRSASTCSPHGGAHAPTAERQACR